MIEIEELINGGIVTGSYCHHDESLPNNFVSLANLKEDVNQWKRIEWSRRSFRDFDTINLYEWESLPVMICPECWVNRGLWRGLWAHHKARCLSSMSHQSPTGSGQMQMIVWLVDFRTLATESDFKLASKLSDHWHSVLKSWSSNTMTPTKVLGQLT